MRPAANIPWAHFDPLLSQWDDTFLKLFQLVLVSCVRGAAISLSRAVSKIFTLAQRRTDGAARK